MKFHDAASTITWRTIPVLGPSFSAFAEGLKRHAERRADPPTST